MAKNQSNIWQVFLFFEWIGLIVAAVLFFAPINGYSLREYYFYSDIEKALGDFLLPGIATKKAFFWIGIIVAVGGGVFKYIVKRNDEDE